MIRSYERRVKLEITHKFFLAASIAEQVGMYLNSENKVRNLWDFFPEMFADERKEYEKMETEIQVKKAAENRKRYAEELNRRRRNGIL